MSNKSEDFFENYLKNIPNEQLMQFYEDLEWTPFPVLVIREHQRRFKTKNKKEALTKLRKQADLALQYSSRLSSKIKSKKVVTPGRNLDLLKKLDELQKKGIITKKDFENKKEELLKRI